jgi:protease-4
MAEQNTSAPAAVPTQILVQQPPSYFGRFGKLLLVALIGCVVVIVGLWTRHREYFSPPHGPLERYHSLSMTAPKKIAIITAAGTILSADGFIKQQIDRVRKDPSVVAVVLRIDSPGGTVTASDYLYHHLKRLREDRNLPIVVSMGSLCASGGYYLAMSVGDQPDAIFAEPTTWTGSIGVVIPHFDLSGLLASWEVQDDSIASHPYKLMGSPTRELTEEERAEERKLLQSLVDESFGRFKEVVRAGRPKFREEKTSLDDVATGQIFTADQALDHGLVDRIGFIEEAVARAAELAGQHFDNLRCVHFVQPPTALETLLGVDVKAALKQSGSLDLATLLDLAAPRAYYLSSWLPSVVEGGS